MDNSTFSRLKRGLSKTSSRILSIFTGNHISEKVWEELEESLILADVGAPIANLLINEAKKDKAALKSPETLLKAIKDQAIKLFPKTKEFESAEKPKIILVIGVNGTGKTTTIAKLSKRYKDSNKKVLLCAADTFRAAAIEQLKNWANSINVPIIAPKEGSDPAAVAYDGVQNAVSNDFDVAMIDTAGRLHTKHNLMEELKKIYRVIGKAKNNAPNEVLLVLDGTAGQNALSQAKVFNEAIPVTALAITKLDGTAKGGIVLRVANELNIPVKYVGIGEKPEDLMDFNAEAYVEALFNL